MSLVVVLERGLPATLPVGASSAIFCAGACFDTDQEIVGLGLEVGGVRHPPSAFGMARPDLVAAHPDWPGHALRCGFWGTVPVPAADVPGPVAVEIAVRFADGGEAQAELGRIEVVAREPPPETPARPKRPERPQRPERPEQPDGETIAVCMATFAPDMGLLRAQIDSLRAQTDQAWICLISDDATPPEHYEQIVELIGDDERFAISRSPERQGFYRNFERALEMVPASAALVALCDQDDRWHDDKLATLRAALGDAVLVYSDQRLVDAAGRVLRSTMWRGRSNNYRSLVSMLVANTITGAATLFRRELLALALPFPDTPGFQFHDTWLSVIALAAGEVRYVDRPLYDYVQHPGAVFGDVTHGRAVAARHGITAWRAAYFYGYLGRAAQAQVALARCGPTMAEDKRRALVRFLACDSSLAATAWLALRAARAAFGHTETLGSELGLVRGLAWKMVATLAARHPRLAQTRLGDASPPPPDAFSQVRLRRWRSRL
ncbi:MAG: glycosyltransferase [Solirubrobacteraceae bacterium]